MTLRSPEHCNFGCGAEPPRDGMRCVSDLSLRARIEQYYATVPLMFADAEEFGPF